MDQATVNLIIQIVVMAVGGVGTAYAIVISLRNRIDKGIGELKAEVGQIGTRLAVVEKSLEAGDGRFGEIRSEIHDILKRLRDVERELDRRKPNTGGVKT
jgi:hypothetical protein